MFPWLWVADVSATLRLGYKYDIIGEDNAVKHGIPRLWTDYIGGLAARGKETGLSDRYDRLILPNREMSNVSFVPKTSALTPVSTIWRA